MACFSKRSQNDAFGSASKGKGMDARIPYLGQPKKGGPAAYRKEGKGRGILHTNRT
jgi:hypothetical protein